MADDEPEALTRGYEAAYALLREKDDNPAAVDAFKALGAEFPDDPLIRFHLKRMSQGIISSRVVMDDK